MSGVCLKISELKLRTIGSAGKKDDFKFFLAANSF